MRVRFILVLLVLVCVGFTRWQPSRTLRRWWTKVLGSHSSMAAPDPHLILEDVNRYREQHGLAPLQYSSTCEKAAQIQVEYNAARGTYTHRHPGYPKAKDRLLKVGHRYESSEHRWAENVLRYTLLRDLTHNVRWHVFHRYHISPHHDKEMLDPVATQFGTASVVEDGVLYNAEVFAN